jgi:LysM repeat protein
VAKLLHLASLSLLTVFMVGCNPDRAPESIPNTSPAPETEETIPDVEEFRETYIVVRGDTLIAIADQFGIHLNDLVRENNIADPTMIYVGQVLLIPPPPSEEDGPLLTIPPPTDPLLPTLEPTSSIPN